MAFLVLLMVFFSGLTGLIYQVTWQKYLSVYLGSHALSTSLTLSSFFLFLSMGYYLVGRLGHKLGKNRIIAYGYIEALIGVYAILSPKLFKFLYEIWPSYASDTGLHFISSLTFAFLLMGFPTLLMGATIPLLTQGLSRKLSEGHVIHSWVYGINTLGAFIGTLIAGFYLLETFGLEQSLNLTGVLNCLICVFLIVYCKITGLNFEGYNPGQSHRSNWTFNSLLGISFLSGFLSFGLESLVIRMAGISLGSSNYTYTIVVAAFILSIALGSFLASISNEKSGRWWLLFNQFALIVSVVLLYLSIPHWPDWNLDLRLTFASSMINFKAYQGTTFLQYLLILVAPVALMGMTLPLLFQQLKRDTQFLSETAGQMYAYNAWGATLGSIVLGYLAFFILDADQVFIGLIATACFCAFLVSKNLNTSLIVKSLPLALLLLAAIALPKWSTHSFIPGRVSSFSRVPKDQKQYNNLKKVMTDKENNKVLFSDYGPNTYTVITENKKGERTVYVNAKPDASTAGDSFTRTLTGLIPLSLAKQNKNVFIIGLGAGLSTGIAASFSGTETVKVAEISKGVIEGLPYFEKWNFDIANNMDKVEIVNDDAYKVLKNEEQTYDLIFSEPSNTWVAGVEKIYTTEFLMAASKRLREDGIYSQWFPLFATTEDSFLSILYNFKKAFKYVTLWSAGGGATIIVASHKPLSADLDQLKNKFANNQEIYKSIKFERFSDILSHQIWPDAAISDLAVSSKIEHSTYHPTLAYQSARAYFINGFVRFENLASKYFSNSEHTKKEQRKINTLHIDESPDNNLLVWEKVNPPVDLDFLERGKAYMASVTPFLTGKISLIKETRFPTNFKEKFTQESKKKEIKSKNKYAQYKFLTLEKQDRLPSLVDEKGFLPSELFTRFLHLKTIRVKSNFERVLETIPDKCKEEEKICFSTKLEVVRYLKPELTSQVNQLTKNYTEEQENAAEKIEEFYSENVSL